MTKQVQQAITPTHVLGSTGTADTSDLGYRTLASFKGDLGLGASLTSLDVLGAAIFNDVGADVDFRVESDTNTHALFLDAGNSRVGINNSSPSDTLHVVGSLRAQQFLTDSGTVTAANLTWVTIITFASTENTAGTVYFNTSGANASAIATFIKSYDGGTSVLSVVEQHAHQSGSIRADGNTIQVRHNVGVTLSCNWFSQKIR